MDQGLTCYLVGFVEQEMLSLQKTFMQQTSLPTPLHIVPIRQKKELASLPSSPKMRQLLLLFLEDIYAPVAAPVFPGNLDVLWFLALRDNAIPWIAVTRAPESFPRAMCLAMGALAYIAEPASDNNIVQTAERALRSVGEPPARKFPLYLMLQIAHALSMSAVLKITSDDDPQKSGFIGLKDGEVFYARSMDGLVGESALSQFFTWSDVSLEVKRTHDFLRGNISTPLADILQSLTHKASDTADIADIPEPPEVPFSPTPIEENSLMADLNLTCQNVVDDVMDAVACGVVDLNSGMLMGVHHTVAYFTQSYLDAVAAAAVDMFRGKGVRRVEQLLSKHRGTPVKDSFQEIFINSERVYHFMKVIQEKEVVVVLVTKKTTNQGMGWSALRGAVSDITAALP